MQRILTTEQMRSADEYTINTLGVTSEILVERAGCAVAEEITRKFKGGRVLVCIGKGNNGQDGLVVAKYLSKIHGFSVQTVNVNNGIFKIFDKKFDIIVDCIFGTGLNRLVEGKYKTAIEKINSSGAYVVSCDIPSGLNGDSGFALGTCVKANLTVAIQEYKLGHFLNDGPDYCGQVVAKDIGISVWGDDFVKKISSYSIKNHFHPRKRNVNKGCFGKAVVFGGSKNYPGSVKLSYGALCALKVGAGYSNLAIPNCLFNALALVNPECTVMTFDDDGENLIFNCDQVDRLMQYDSIAFGMGVGINEQVFNILRYLIKNYKKRLIIDADGLNCLARFGLDVLKEKKCEVVLTPHVGEFVRLTGLEKQSVLENPIKLASEFALKYNVIVVLKSATTVITNGKETYLNVSGTSGLAKAGSGDLLSGVLAGIVARSSDLIEGVAIACDLFGKAGENAVKEQNEWSITASEVIKQIPVVINEYRED